MKIFAKAQQAEASRRTQVRINMKILFFSKRCYPPVRVWRLILKKIKGSFRDVWITNAFFRERFYRGGCTFTSFCV